MSKLLYFTVFYSGLTALGAEFIASRLLDPVFGTSQPVWAAVIGMILIYFTLGYFLGGRFVDADPRPQNLFTLLAWGGFSLGIIPFISAPILRAAARAFDSLELGFVAGAFVSVLVLFIIPITLMAMTSPYAVRLLMKDAALAGNIAGRVSAISTVGSVFGVFLPTIVFIPLIGVRRTALLFGGALILLALYGMFFVGARRRFWIHLPLVVVLAVLWAWNPPIKDTPGQILEKESAHNYIEVLEVDGYRMLRLNDGQGVHSVYHPDNLYYAGPWEQFLVAPFFVPGTRLDDVERIAIVGLAAGTSARQATAIWGDIPIDGWEIDGEIVAVAREYFDMTMPNLNVYVQDGRWGLSHSPHQYTLIVVDAYRPPYIPPHMTTQEFFTICAERLTENGVLAINIGRAPGDRRLIEGLASTIGTVLPYIYVMDLPNTFNSILYASRTPASVAALAENFDAMRADPAVHPLLRIAMQTTLQNIQPAPAPGMVFTDDHAPIEWITNTMVMSFIFEGGVETMR
jgi:spermidine synthase